jgi:hypothetical protein
MTSAGKRGVFTYCRERSTCAWLLMEVEGMKLFLLMARMRSLGSSAGGGCLAEARRKGFDYDFLRGARCRTENLILAILMVRCLA